jgi:hypothetical protein
MFTQSKCFVNKQEFCENIFIFFPSFFLVQLFRHIRRRKSTRMEKLKTLLNIKEDKTKKKKRNIKHLRLPWWFKFIAYAISFSFAGVSLFFVIIKGIEFGNEKVAGPQAFLDVPKFTPAATPPDGGPVIAEGAEAKASGPESPSALGWLPWRLPDGAMTPWMPGTPPPSNPSSADQAISEAEASRLAEQAKAKGEPAITGAAAAAEVLPAAVRSSARANGMAMRRDIGEYAMGTMPVGRSSVEPFCGMTEVG